MPSGRILVFKSRIGWAQDRLKRAGLTESAKRGYWQVTKLGRALAGKHPNGLPEELVRDIALMKWNGGTSEASTNGPTPPVDSAAPEQTPDERMEGAHQEIQAKVRDELLEAISEMSPTFFERLVLDVLHRMRYGAERGDLKTTNGGSDGGIDGVISLDRLGLQKVYVQAKRYAAEHAVGRPAIQSFVGALAGRRATRGIFITTSRFSKEATDYAGSASDSLVLVDGQRLTSLMIEYRVGVSHRETYVLVDLDSDYFSEE